MLFNHNHRALGGHTLITKGSVVDIVIWLVVRDRSISGWKVLYRFDWTFFLHLFVLTKILATLFQIWCLAPRRLPFIWVFIWPWGKAHIVHELDFGLSICVWFYFGLLLLPFDEVMFLQVLHETLYLLLELFLHLRHLLLAHINLCLS